MAFGPKALGPSMVRIDRHGRVLENRYPPKPFRLVRKLTAQLPPAPSLLPTWRPPAAAAIASQVNAMAKEKAPLFDAPFDSIRSARQNSTSGFHRRSGCE
jgi:hypothetical protein